jgi:3D (Asp-Asp-Asp) domain-containing protein
MRRKVLSTAGLLLMAPAAAACGGTPPRASDENVVPDTYVTAYTWFDNTPEGSPDISHPVLHKKAGGTGTYEDPVTISVGHSLKTGDDVLVFPAGTRIYLPDVRRYFIVEDTCGDGPTPEDGPCHSGADEHGDASIWIDIWIGGEGENASFAQRCTQQVTGVRTAVFDPADNYIVASGGGVMHDGECDTGYGNDLVNK